MKNNSTWDNMIKPVVVLFSICFVVSGLLAATNSVTAPIIAENALKAEQAALLELLPEASGFTEIENVDMENVNKVYSSDAGYVVTAASKGYGGDVEWMVAFDMEGTIKGAKVLSQNETAGLGAKCEEEWFQTQFTGRTDVLAKDNIDMISGATITSNASIKAINAARDAFNKYGLGVEVVKVGPTVSVYEDTYSVTVPGYADADTVITATIVDGAITAVTIDESANASKMASSAQLETLASSAVAANSAEFDGVAGVTFTSDAVKAGIAAILDAYTNGTAVAGEAPAVQEDTLPEEKEEPVEEELPEGAVTGTGAGFGGDINVVITFDVDGNIATCDITANDETPAIGGAALEDLASQVIAAGSAEIDGVAGATLTTNGVKDAVNAALGN